MDRCLPGLLGQLLVRCSGQLQARIPRTEYCQGIQGCTCWSTRAVTCQIILCNYLKEINQILIIVVFLSGINREIWTIDRVVRTVAC
jgi:hypothetical protein